MYSYFLIFIYFFLSFFILYFFGFCFSFTHVEQTKKQVPLQVRITLAKQMCMMGVVGPGRRSTPVFLAQVQVQVHGKALLVVLVLDWMF